MRSGEYALTQQVGSKGYYGEVRLEVELLDSPRLAIDFEPASFSDWSIGIQFGIAYGWKHFRRSRQDMKGAKVRVVGVKGQPADTTSLVLAFVSGNALWNALGWSPPNPPVLDPKTGCFTFSKY